MNERDHVLNEALALPPEDREYVVAALEESLSPAGDSQAAELLSELKRRTEAYRAGVTASRPASEVLDDQRRRQAGEAQL